MTERMLNIKKNRIFETLFLCFPLKTSPPAIIYIAEKGSQLLLSTNTNYSSHALISELIVFIHSLNLYLGCKKLFSYVNTKESSFR